MYFNPTTSINRFYITTLISLLPMVSHCWSVIKESEEQLEAVCIRYVAQDPGETTGVKTKSKYSFSTTS